MSLATVTNRFLNMRSLQFTDLSGQAYVMSPLVEMIRAPDVVTVIERFNHPNKLLNREYERLGVKLVVVLSPSGNMGWVFERELRYLSSDERS